MPYSPSRASTISSVEELQRYLEGELQRISVAMNETEALDLRPVFKAPLRPREGMIIFADGTSFDPGSGKGTYEYKAGVWVKLF